MNHYQSLSIVLAIFNLFVQLNANYTHGELNDLIKYSQWNFSLFIIGSNGIILYAIDSNERVVIKFEEEAKNREYILLYNNKTDKYLKSINIAECNERSVKHLQFIINFNENKLIIKCKLVKNLLISEVTQKESKIRYNQYPIPLNYYNNTKQTFIWMGNIGRYVGYNNKSYYPIKSQSIGCVEYFFTNNKSITMQSYGNMFLSNCTTKSMNENICNHGECINRTIPINMFDCSIPGINEIVCDRIKLSTYNPNNQSYIINPVNTKSIIISFIWKQIFVNDYCLIEMKLKNYSKIIIHVNKNNQILYSSISDKMRSNTIPKILNKISINKINKLLIEYRNSELVLKILNDDGINIFIDEYIDEPIMIDVGKSQHADICQTFQGLFEFHCNTSQQIFNESITQSNKKPNNNGIQIIIISTVIGTVLVISFFAGFYCYSQRLMKFLLEKNTPTPNIQNHYEICDHIENISSPIRENCELEKFSDYVYYDNNDNNSYETITMK